MYGIFIRGGIDSMSSAGSKKVHRRSWIDYTRGFIIIYVVYRHALTGMISAGVDIKNAIYLVQESSMPIFFIVSGIFIHSSAMKRGLDTFVRFKFESLMYPYFLWGAIHLTLQIIFSQYSNSDKDIGYYAFLFTFPRAIDQFWYLYTLFAAMVIFATLNFRLLKFSAPMNVAVALAMYLASYFITTDDFSLHDILFYYLFLVFGFLMAETLLPVDSTFFRGKWLVYFLPVFVVLQIVWQIYYPDATQLHQLDFGGFLIFVPITIIGSLMLFFISNKLDEWGLLKSLRYIGSHSLYIYIMHLMFTSIIRVILLKVYPEIPPLLMLVLIIAGGVFIPIICYRIFVRFNISGLFEPPQRVRNVIYGKSKPQ